MTIDAIITEILKREGWDKFTDHPADRGGPTKWGITQDSWSAFIGRAATVDDVRKITELQAREFYRHRHVVAPGFDHINDAALRELAIDAGVNHGIGWAAKTLQQIVGARIDGDIGPESLRAINAAPAHALYLRLCAARFRLYGRLTTKDPKLQAAKAAGFRLQAENTWGWCNRVAGFLEAAAPLK